MTRPSQIDQSAALRAASRYIAKLEALLTAQESELSLLRMQLREAQERAAGARGPVGDELRRRVLEQQALRARLAKTDMSPHARLRTLKAAKAAGLDLSDAQASEFWRLKFDLG